MTAEVLAQAGFDSDSSDSLPIVPVDVTAEYLAAALDVALPEINVDDFRRSGYLPEVVCNFLALNGWSPGENVEKFDNEFIKKRFELKRVVKTPAKFDRVKLLAFNCDAITGMARPAQKGSKSNSTPRCSRL